MSVRLRRLQADHEQIKRGLQSHPAIRIRGVSGAPPDRYQIEYAIRSLQETATGSVTERTEHVAEIYLTLGYPRQAPQCRMLTPVFHPNIAPHAICIGDHWAAGESLFHLIIRIGEMLAYQSYNVKSPLNGAAARWVEENTAHVPTDPRDLAPTDWTAPRSKGPVTDECQNCRGRQDLARCTNGHLVCKDCIFVCPRCGKTCCLLCGPQTCPVCGEPVCAECRRACSVCSTVVCATHLKPCAICGEMGCPDCIIPCSVCGRDACASHIRQCVHCRATVCLDHASACAGCHRPTCPEHSHKCGICDSVCCPDCTFVCAVCGIQVCVHHVAQCAICKNVLCPTHTQSCAQCGAKVCGEHFNESSGTCARCGVQGPAA